MIILESKYQPGDIVCLRTDPEGTLWMVDFVGKDVNEVVLYGLKAGIESSIHAEIEVIPAMKEDGETIWNIIDMGSTGTLQAGSEDGAE